MTTQSNGRGKYQPKITRPCDWAFETKLYIIRSLENEFLQFFVFLLQPTTHKACYYGQAATPMVAIQNVVQTFLFFALSIINISVLTVVKFSLQVMNNK